jgi:hypothetical protein
LWFTPFVNATAPLSPTDRFSCLIEGLFEDVAAAAPLGWVAIPLIKLLWRRLRRMSRLFAAILARFRAGTLPAPGSAPRRPAPARPAAASDPSHGPRPLDQPRRFGWVLQMTYAAMVRRFDLVEMLDDPETVALVAGAPQLGRVLRPLCRMLALKPPAWLRLPRRRASRPPPPRPTIIRLGAGDLWRGPDSLWPTREEAQKFDAKIRVWPDER